MRNLNALRAMGVAGAAVLTLGCAAGKRMPSHDEALSLQASGSALVAVATQDGRAKVKSGQMPKTYAGSMRGAAGNPFNVLTQSGKPFAEDVTGVICSALRKRGFSCAAVSVEPDDSREDAAAKLKAGKAERLVLVAVSEWHSETTGDITGSTHLVYNVALTVMDGAGDKLAESSVKGLDDLGGSAWNPYAHAVKVVPGAYRAKLESLLNDPSVIGALK